MMTKIREVLKGSRGQGMVEYALILALIAAVVIAATRLIGSNASTKMNGIATDVANI